MARSPIGVLLAGGRGRRLGGDKAAVGLNGRPLAQWAIDALAGALDHVVVACRLDTALPALAGVREAWVEPEGPRGPLAGVISALREAHGRPVVTLGLGLPLVERATVRMISAAASHGRSAVVAEADGELEPLLARWEPSALRVLAGLPAGTPLTAALEALDPARAPVDRAQLLRVEHPEDLLKAGAALDARRRRLRVLA